MRILIGATRALLSTVISLHIAAIRVGVYMNDRKVSAAKAATDAASFAVSVARAAVHMAIDLCNDAYAAERRAQVENYAYRAAANEEVSALRRGVHF